MPSKNTCKGLAQITYLHWDTLYRNNIGAKWQSFGLTYWGNVGPTQQCIYVIVGPTLGQQSIWNNITQGPTADQRKANNGPSLVQCSLLCLSNVGKTTLVQFISTK